MRKPILDIMISQAWMKNLVFYSPWLDLVSLSYNCVHSSLPWLQIIAQLHYHHCTCKNKNQHKKKYKWTHNSCNPALILASIIVPGGQEFYFPHFPQTFLIESSSFLPWKCLSFSTLKTWEQFLCGLPGPQRKKIIWMNIMRTFARVVGVARDKTRNSFSARGGKKVAHHCFKG